MIGSLASFGIFAALLTITPGLDTMFVVRTAAISGQRAGFAAALGIGLGCLCWALAGGLGITALVTASAVGYDVMRWVGAAYLGYLGLRTLWRARSVSPIDAQSASGEPVGAVVASPRAPHVAFRSGLMTNLLNPKAGVFYLAALPQFLPHGVAPLLASFALGAVHVVENLIWFAGLVTLVRRAAGWFARRDVRRWLDRVAGVVFIGFGVRLVLASS